MDFTVTPPNKFSELMGQGVRVWQFA